MRGEKNVKGVCNNDKNAALAQQTTSSVDGCRKIMGDVRPSFEWMCVEKVAASLDDEGVCNASTFRVTGMSVRAYIIHACCIIQSDRACVIRLLRPTQCQSDEDLGCRIIGEMTTTVYTQVSRHFITKAFF